MIEDILKQVQLHRKKGRQCSWKPYPLESRAHIPLPPGSTPSEAAAPTTSEDISQAGTSEAGATTNSAETIRLHEAQEPFRHYIESKQRSLDVKIDELTILFEFSELSTGYVTVTCCNMSSDARTLDVLAIPTKDEIKIANPSQTAQQRIRLLHAPSTVVDIQFDWVQSENGNAQPPTRLRSSCADGVHC